MLFLELFANITKIIPYRILVFILYAAVAQPGLCVILASFSSGLLGATLICFTQVIVSVIDALNLPP